MSELVEKKTIGEVERIVHASGMWDGTDAVEFSNDGETWAESWAPSDQHPLPEFARVTVYRKDVRVGTRVTIRWDEQVPRADEFWAGKWVSAPMRHFGRTARMVAFRQTFRDLLGDIVIEDEADDRAEHPEPAAERDWEKEIAEAESEELLDAIKKDGRAARIFTATPEGTALWRAIDSRRREIRNEVTDAKTAWDVPTVTTVIEVPEVAADRPTRPAPQDHLPPANRAARRKAARKKGGKR